MRNPQKQRIAKTRYQKMVLYGSIVLSVVLLVFIVGAVYVNSLVRLVRGPDYTGNATLQESDLTDPEDTSDQTASGGDITETGYTGEPSIHESDLVEPDETLNEPDSTDTIDQAEAEFEAVQAIAVPQDNNVYNILLIGTDSRGSEINGRSDSMVLLSVNKRTRRVSLVSLMRSLYVKIPGRGHYMLNASYSYGGPKLLLRTIEDNLRIHINDYVAINFQGFVKVIDTIGGVGVTLTAAELNYLTKLHPTAGLVVGANNLTGAVALEFARIRKIDSDFRRTGRQREVLESLIKKLSALSLEQMDATARQLLPQIRTNKTGTALVDMAVSALSYRSYPIKQLMLPIDGSHRMIVVRGMQMEWFDKVDNVKALHKMLY